MSKRFYLAIVTIALIFPKLHAQDSSDMRIRAVLKSLNDTSNTLANQISTLQTRIENKKAYLLVLQERLRQAESETNDTIKLHKLSRYSYQIFLLTSRINAEEIKLREAEVLHSFVARLDSSAAPSLLKKEMADLTIKRKEFYEKLLQKSETYQLSITEPAFKAQFDRLLKNIRAEQERLKSE